MTLARDEAYVCVRCAAALRPSAAGLSCPRCACVFPVVGGMPILAHRPEALLAAAQGWLDDAASRLARTREMLAAATARDEWPEGLVERASRMACGTEQNLAVFGRYMAPVTHHVSSRPRRSATPLDWIAANGGGWDAHGMLPYFYQDWGEAPPLGQAAAIIADALERERPDAESVAVLGAGACGMVHAVASLFERAYGLDLSIPTLLLAQGLLRGDEVVLHLRQAQWRPVRVTGPARRGDRTQVIVADAAALPFADGALSAILTQYLLDVVGNPLAVAAEIGRVLKPGGVWVNFSTPFSLPHEPAWAGPPSLDELPRVLEPCGFEVRTRERRQFALLDLTGIDPAASKVIEDVSFFAARRTAQRSVPRETASWTAVPALMPSRPVHLVRKTAYPHPHKAQWSELAVGRRVAQVSQEDSRVVDALLSEIDGTHTAREIFERVTAAGWNMSAEDFLELLDCLCRQHGVLELRAA